MLVNEVHVWQASLQVSSVTAWVPLLSADEQARANRFKFAIHRDRFIAARGMLRQLLASYLNDSPQHLTFCYGDRGKPALVNAPIQFNVSHSEDVALYAISSHPVGIDVEKIREIDVAGLSQRFFTAAETHAIAQLPPEQRLKSFFRYWTCKEAYLKATGEGLSGLSGLEIFLAGEARLTAENAAVQSWVLRELDVPTAFVGTLAVRAEATAIHISQFDFEIPSSTKG
jgi:4'-phosphopantetheinyl transferase